MRLAALRFPRIVIDDVAKLVELHLRFHGYGRGEWTDSAVRRYVRDAASACRGCTRWFGPTRPPATGARPGASPQAYDDLEARIERLRQQEEIDAIRPIWTATRSWRYWTCSRGPWSVGRRGTCTTCGWSAAHWPEEEATQELLRWWAEQPEASA